MREEFEKASVGVAYIAGQSCRGLLGAQSWIREHKIEYPYLCDAKREVVRSYGVYNPISLDGVHVAHPAVFLLDPERRVRFFYVGRTSTDRVPPERVLEEFGKLE